MLFRHTAICGSCKGTQRVDGGQVLKAAAASRTAAVTASRAVPIRTGMQRTLAQADEEIQSLDKETYK
jgi:hypothetical protein